ncbi:flavoprotein [Streptosporangium sp. NPDC050855]|uniref:flavoprotein n=1 Tax=Streptosporangium sp. NPDC050855 TaxID=3366194 RepID=UPI0037BC33FA
MTGSGRVLYVIVCAAGAAGGVGRLVTLAQDDGWIVQVVATPSALGFVDVPALERQTGRPVRSRYRTPDEPKPPRADAIIVAPATYNTVNKFAQGIADTYALGLLAEAPGLGIPVVVLPFVSAALASRTPFRDSVERLRAEGVRVLSGPGEFEPGDGSDADVGGDHPWHLAVSSMRELTSRPPDGPA